MSGAEGVQKLPQPELLPKREKLKPGKEHLDFVLLPTNPYPSPQCVNTTGRQTTAREPGGYNMEELTAQHKGQDSKGQKMVGVGVMIKNNQHN